MSKSALARVNCATGSNNGSSFARLPNAALSSMNAHDSCDVRTGIRNWNTARSGGGVEVGHDATHNAGEGAAIDGVRSESSRAEDVAAHC